MIDLDGRDRRRHRPAVAAVAPAFGYAACLACCGPTSRSVAPLRGGDSPRARDSGAFHLLAPLPILIAWQPGPLAEMVTALEAHRHSLPHTRRGALLDWRCSGRSARRARHVWPTPGHATTGSRRNRNHVLAAEAWARIGARDEAARLFDLLAPYTIRSPQRRLLARLDPPTPSACWPPSSACPGALDCFARRTRSRAHAGRRSSWPAPAWPGPPAAHAPPARGHRAGDRPPGERAGPGPRHGCPGVPPKPPTPASGGPAPIHRPLAVRLAAPHWPVRGPGRPRSITSPPP